MLTIQQERLNDEKTPLGELTQVETAEQFGSGSSAKRPGQSIMHMIESKWTKG